MLTIHNLGRIIRYEINTFRVKSMIGGYTYKGYSIINPIHNASQTKYTAEVINLNLPHKPKWELVVLTPVFKFKDDGTFSVMLWDENKLHTTTTINVQAMKSISHFRQTYEQLIDRMLSLQLTSAPVYSSHSFQSNGTQRMYINSNGHATIGTGIINHVNNSGTTIPYGQIVQSIQSMQQTITNLTNNANNK